MSAEQFVFLSCVLEQLFLSCMGTLVVAIVHDSWIYNYIYFKHILLFKKTKDKTQVKQLRQSSPITYITKYTIKYYNLITQFYSKVL